MKTISMDVGTGGIAVLSIDVPERAMNVLTPELIAELDTAIAAIAKDPAVNGAIITSGKSNGFIAGADLNDLAAAYGKETAAQAYARSAGLSDVYRRIEMCGKPIAAAINGLALGGGLELCLACHYRVLANDVKSIVGLPEVKVGLLPGAGGTQRLPRLIGIANALPMMISGDPVSPARALQLGIVHEIAPAEELVAKARIWTLSHPAARQPWDLKGFKLPGGAGCLAPHAVESFQAGASRMSQATQRNYPAPQAIMSAVFEGTQVPIDMGLSIESKYFARLLTDPVARNLMRTMFINKGAADKLARRPAVGPKTVVRKIGVLGAGMMGAGIAYIAAVAGIEVALLDTTVEQAEKGRQYAAKILAKEREKGRITADAAAERLARIVPTVDYASLGDCELIVEAVFESRDIKQEVWEKACAAAGRDTLFATNTSTLPITGLAKSVTNPDRFIGIHFFSPVERMPLVEIIRGRKTNDWAVARALDFASQLRKTPIVVNDSPGFFTSRVFGAFIDEGMAMLAEGVAPALIENTARMAGMPVGPLAITDEVAIDLQLKVHKQALADGLVRRFQRLTAIDVVKSMVARGRVGRREGAGFYDYPADAKKHLWRGLSEVFPPARRQPSVADLKTRFLFIQAVETARCLEEGVLIHPADADIGSILGIGFPSWTGGALSFIETVGIDSFVATARLLTRRHGARFKPPAFLMHAKSDFTFYPAAA